MGDITKISGTATSLFSWANAEKCDACGMEHKPDDQVEIKWFKGELLGRSPHRRGDIALCIPCAYLLQDILNELDTKIKWFNRGI